MHQLPPVHLVNGCYFVLSLTLSAVSPTASADLWTAFLVVFLVALAVFFAAFPVACPAFLTSLPASLMSSLALWADSVMANEAKRVTSEIEIFFMPRV